MEKLRLKEKQKAKSKKPENHEKQERGMSVMEKRANGRHVCDLGNCHATCILRVALGFVFVYYSIMILFFGMALPVDINELITFIPADVGLFCIGMIEFIIGTLLVVGLFTRIAGWTAGAFFVVLFGTTAYLHFSGIFPDLWFYANLAKDVGLLGAAVAIGLNGAPCCSIDAFIKKK